MKEFCRVLFNRGHCSAPFQHSAPHVDFVGQEQVAKMGDSKLGDHQARWSAHGSAAWEWQDTFQAQLIVLGKTMLLVNIFQYLTLTHPEGC